MNLIAQMIDEEKRREAQRTMLAARSLADDDKKIMSELSRIIAPVADEIELQMLEKTLNSARDACHIASWRICCTRLNSFFLTYQSGDGWRLEARREDGHVLEVACILSPRDGVVDWQAETVRNFLYRRLKKDAPTAVGPVWVLAEWDQRPTYSPDESGDHVLIKFSSRDLINDLHSLVRRLHVKPSGHQSPDLRIYGVSVECDSPQVDAWHVQYVWADEHWPGHSLGDGWLLSQPEADSVRTGGGVLDRIIMEVRDDGMMLVKCDDGWATIDLTGLATAVANRK